ncbi:cupin domain-containing protein [Muriicola soli]|uniref:Cupin domain-containing protein n=1 Tax=Muriicola soli TaxID=2507538 RepID=A0A411E8G6_9FLAO|nr:hypothetical protein [Muriicola soli]QBA64011.1 hypothetical protein EQY75_05340 [Muriicola soli]
MKTLRTILSLLICTLFSQLIFSQSVAQIDTEEIITSYVEDFKNDRFASEPMIFGLEVVNHESWTIHVTGNKTEAGWEVVLKEGLPTLPTFIYSVEKETLRAIFNGELNALTAQGKAFAGDYAPMNVKEMEGFESDMDMDSKINAFSFHFWTRGFPEIVPFADGLTRKAHGSNFVVFYYQKGLRTAWYRVLPEEKVRHDPREQAMPFPMLIVAIKGVTEGEVDGKRVSLTEGNTVFIPPFAAHKWWNETNEASEAILIMFGEGA